MIAVKLHKQIGSFQIRTAFEASDHETTALFGPSGSGKTTLIHMIAGIIRPDAGHITINETILFDSEKRINLPMERRHIGYVFQDGRLFPHLSVRRNLKYGAHNESRGLAYVRFEDVVELLGIEHLLDRKPAKLSGGEKQRVAIGRALLTQPSLILMDEPLASLDNDCKKEILPFIRRLSTEFRIPIIYVSHVWEEIETLATQVVAIEQGAATGAKWLKDVQRYSSGVILNDAAGETMLSENRHYFRPMPAPEIYTNEIQTRKQ